MARCRTKQHGSASLSGTASQKLPHSICKKENRFTLRDACAWKSTSIGTASRGTRSKFLQRICSLSDREAATRCRTNNEQLRRARVQGRLIRRQIYPTTIFRSSNNRCKRKRLTCRRCWASVLTICSPTTERAKFGVTTLQSVFL